MNILKKSRELQNPIFVSSHDSESNPTRSITPKYTQIEHQGTRTFLGLDNTILKALHILGMDELQKSLPGWHHFAFLNSHHFIGHRAPPHRLGKIGPIPN